MFSTLKLSTLRSRSRSKEQTDKNIAQENPYDDNDDADVSCTPSLKCQQPFNKCSSKQSNKNRYSKTQKVCAATNTIDSCPHSDIFFQSDEKYCSRGPSMYVVARTADVCVERDDDGNLGLTLQGGLHQNPEYCRPLFVTYVRPDGPTDREGTIQMGDRLLAIDGYPLDNVTLNEAYDILRNSNGHSARLTIEYDVTNMQTFSGPLLVELESPHPRQLGLTLTNTPHNAAVLIDEIKIASIAERFSTINAYSSGALHPGDQILSVNDTRIEGSRIPATEVYKLLRICEETHSNLLLQILPASTIVQNRIAARSPKLSYSPRPRVSLEQAYLSNYYEVPNEYLVPNGVRENEPNKNTGKTKQMTITLHSDDRLGYGLSVHSVAESTVAVISSIVPSGPADSCERLQINDRIISINDMPLTGISIDPQPLHKVPGIPLGSVIMLVEYDLYDTVVSITDNILAVELMKCNRKNLGITMTGSSESMQISDIKQGSVADRCGVLALGDKILSINNQLLAKCSLQEALNILHSSADTVFLEVEKQFDNNDSTNTNENNVEYTVQLNKQNGSIGITITGSETTPREITIAALAPGGLAEKTGALHVGDRVLEINDCSVDNVLLSEAMTILQNSGDKVLFKVSRNSSTPVQNYDLASNRIYGSPGLISDDSAVESWESSTQRDVSPNDISFQNVQSGLDYKQENENNQEHLIPHVIVPQNGNGLANEEPIYSNISYFQNINANEQIYSCNKLDRLARNVSHQLSNLPQNKSLENERKKDFQFSNVDEIFNIADLHENIEFKDSIYEIYEVVLYKDPLYEDFGFSISDGLYERGVFLNRIRQGGPADKIGLLRPYDRIIQVNNTKTDDFDCCLTVPLIASAGEKITLVVKRKKRDISSNKKVS